MLAFLLALTLNVVLDLLFLLHFYIFGI